MLTYSKRRRGDARSACEYAIGDTAVSLAGLERKSTARCSCGVSGTCASRIPSTGADQAAFVGTIGVGLEETLAGERRGSPSWGWCAAGRCSRRCSAVGVFDEVFDTCGRAG